jgi:CRP-like cAMP-binding protein
MQHLNNSFGSAAGHSRVNMNGHAGSPANGRDRWQGEAADADGLAKRRGVNNGLLSKMPGDIYKRLRPYLKEVTLEKDDYLYQQDDFVDSVYFPESSVISEFQILEDGRTIEVAITGPEGAIGVSSAFSPSTATSCTQVCVPGSVWKIKSDVLEREIAKDPELNRLLHDQINTNIRQLSQKIICNTYHSLEQRFSTWLLEMTQRCNTNRLQVTQEHVARVLGVHRPSVTYIAQELRDLKLIDYRRGRIIVTNREALKEHACMCYSENVVETDAVVSLSHWNSQAKH